MSHTRRQTGYAEVNGLRLYYELQGEEHVEGPPLVLLHGGFGMTGMFGPLLTRMAEQRRVIAVDLQGHGRTADIDRPLRYETMADDIAALIEHLGHPRADVMGYSLGGGVALRLAIQHPQLVEKLVVVSTPFSHEGWYPEIFQGISQMTAEVAEGMKSTPMYQSYVAIAPKPENFTVLADKLGDLLRREYDWSREVAALRLPVMLVYGDHDSIRPAHILEFFAKFGGGQKDAGWDGADMCPARLAILPGLTHYNVFTSALVAQVALAFLSPQ